MTAVRTRLAYNADDRPSFDYASSINSSEDMAITPTSLPRTPTLTLRKVEPEQLNKSADAADRVARIRWLEVVPREHLPGDRPSYHVRIFLKEPLGRLHTPTFARLSHVDDSEPTKMQPPHIPETEPDICVTKRFRDFQRLRHAVMDAVEGPHKAYCHLCGALQAMLTFSSVRPAMAVWALLPAKTKINVLNCLLRSVVDEYRSHLPPPSRRPANRRHACQGERSVPVLLHEFLFDADQSSNGASVA